MSFFRHWYYWLITGVLSFLCTTVIVALAGNPLCFFMFPVVWSVVAFYDWMSRQP